MILGFHGNQEKGDSTAEVGGNKSGKNVKNKDPESCLGAQESDSFQGDDDTQGHTTERARSHDSTSKKLCFFSGHFAWLLDKVFESPNRRSSTNLSVFFLLDVGIEAVFCAIVAWLLGLTSSSFCALI
jgi:hypothetical protein